MVRKPMRNNMRGVKTRDSCCQCYQYPRFLLSVLGKSTAVTISGVYGRQPQNLCMLLTRQSGTRPASH